MIQDRMLLKVLLSCFMLWVMVRCDEEQIKKLFEDLNDEVLSFNRQTAKLAWDSFFNSSSPIKAAEIINFSDIKRKWTLSKCKQLKGFSALPHQQEQRVFNFLCRGPRFTSSQQKQLIDSSDRVEKVFTTTRLCIPRSLNICREPEKLWTSTFVKLDNDIRKVMFEPIMLDVQQPQNVEDLKCFTGEPELEKLMANGNGAFETKCSYFKFSNENLIMEKKNFLKVVSFYRNAVIAVYSYADFSEVSHDVNECMRRKNEIQFWIWESWRVAVGPRIKNLYPRLVNLMNWGAREGGFEDIGEMWNSQLELGEDVGALMERLMKEIQPLYNMLHAFVKSILIEKREMKRGPNIPAHILGWNANWQHLMALIETKFFPTSHWNIDKAIFATNWNATQMVKRAEDFYTSVGLKRLTDTFWNKSLISEACKVSCHGTAADMLEPDDFRMIVCGYKNAYDFYVIIHELGHIEQYMLAEKQAVIFRAGNSIIQESIGDAIFLGMMTPMHLNRLRLIDDKKLFPSTENNFDLQQLMMIAFMKLPEIPFGFVFEKFRYDLFAGRVSFEKSNDYFWELTKKYQRIEPTNANADRHFMFDAAAKFHLATNVPYARYFFANILQYQVYRAMCEKTFYGRLNSNQTLSLPLHKCDIYGSKRAGSLLKKALTPGSLFPLKTLLKTLTGTDEISTDALKEYYEPLMNWLREYLIVNNIAY